MDLLPPSNPNGHPTNLCTQHLILTTTQTYRSLIMGLDMFLYGEYELPAYESEGKSYEERMEAYRHPPVRGKRLDRVRQACGLPTNLPVEFEDFNWLHVQFPIAKWRKENAIHKWFIDNCAPRDHKNKPIDDCKPFFVSESKINELDRLLDTVLRTKGLEKDLTARKTLPTCSGCFFGSTGYDEWYWRGLKYTSDRIKALIKYQDTQNEKDNKRKDGVGKMFDAIYYRASW